MVSNKAYDIIHFISLLIMPVCVFLTSLGDIWGIPYATQICATLAALDVFVGALVVILKKTYNNNQEVQ